MRGSMECSEIDTKRETDPKRHKGHWAAPALSLDSLTHRCHPSLSSSCRCPSLGLGAGEVGVGHRAQGLGVLKVLPLRSWPGCAPKCRGSGAAHHTTGEGTNWRSVSSGASLPQITQGARWSPRTPAAVLLSSKSLTELSKWV